MFENDDWNIDEDYLKDFNTEVSSNDIQREGKHANTSENTDIQDKSLVQVSQLVFNNSAIENGKEEIKTQIKESVCRKNVVLDIFKKNDLPCNSAAVSSANSIQPSALNSQVICDDRRNLVLNVFQNNETSSINPPVNSKLVVKSVLKVTNDHLEHENKLKRKKHVAFTESVNQIENIAKRLCVSSTNQDRASRSILFGADHSGENTSSNMRQIPVLIEKNSRVPRMKQTLTRKFPGPAGLLPDNIDESQVIDLDSLDENENKNYADLCSQNTKNLFTTGAWQLMMDDLPADFELCEIATIKENALQYSKRYKRVPFIAGIIQYIDYKPNDPHIVLKDLSGKIDARIHHSVCKLYPNALGINTVLFVKDVGLIVTSKKYICMIISLKNLISIYSDEAKLVETCHLKQLENNNYHCDLNSSQISVLEESDNSASIEKKSAIHQELQEIQSSNKSHSASETHKEKEANKISSVGRNVKSNKNRIEVGNEMTDVQEFDFNEDDSWLNMNIDDQCTFKTDEFPSSTPLDTNKSKCETICQEGKTNKVNTVNVNHNIENSRIIGNHNSSVNRAISHSSKVNTTVDNEATKSKDMKYKMKLSAFRSKHVLTPPSSSGEDSLRLRKETLPTHENQTIKKNVLVDNTNVLLNCYDDDTDDEILSQLDVDAIAASYDR